MTPDSHAYWEGRRARGAGRPRELLDARWSVQSRTEWFAGWDDEDRFRAPKLTPEEVERQLAGLRKVRESL